MEFVEQLKSQIDIVQVVGEYVRLRKMGTRYVGLCPFHSEKTPSFGVRATHQHYKCFGCGAGGDAIHFIMEIEGLSFWESVKLLAERHGIPLPKRSVHASEEDRLRSGLYEMHEEAQRLFRAALDSAAGAEARAYLERRGVDPGLTEEFALGLAERGGQALARRFQQAGFASEQMEASGLVLRRQDGSGHFDRFRGRLMFPIQNESGKVIAFAGRALAPNDEPKYLNSPETPIYRKGYVLYNLHRARKGIRENAHSVLVEGYMDVIGLHGAGIRHAVASCGTALTNNQVRTLKRYADQVVVNFDPDTAGAAAAERSIQMMLEEGLRIRVLQLPDGLDPDEFVKQQGADAYRRRLEGARRYFEWLAERARQKFDVRTVEGRSAGFQFLLPAIQRISDKLERVGVANEVAAYLGVESGLVLEQFRKLAADRTRGEIRTPPAGIPPTERLLLRCLLESAESRADVLPRLPVLLGEVRLETQAILEVLAGLGERYSYSALEGRLGDADRNLLATIAFADEMEEDPISAQQALACVDKLAAGSRAAQRAELAGRIKAAEKEGRLAEALRLMRELDESKRGEVRRPPAVVE